jgi:hypothetical protein
MANEITNEIENKKPHVNISSRLENRRKFSPPKNVFIPLNRKKYPVENITGFTNAKGASMLEKGWRLAYNYELYLDGEGYKNINKEVLMEYYDGPSIPAKLLSIQRIHNKEIFTFESLTPPHTKWELSAKDIKRDYTAIYFKNTRNLRKTRKQKGGFYPSVFAGVRNASMLMPFVMRQCYRMWDSSRKTRRKH